MPVKKLSVQIPNIQELKELLDCNSVGNFQSQRAVDREKQIQVIHCTLHTALHCTLLHITICCSTV